MRNKPNPDSWGLDMVEEFDRIRYLIEGRCGDERGIFPKANGLITLASKTVYIGLGSNLGDRAQQIAQALAILDSLDGISVVRVADLIETEPIGGPAGQNNYLNSVAQFHCSFSAVELLAILLDVEKQLGRKRKQKWGSRTIDLDLLLFEDQVIDEPHLQVPHPLLHEREFVLKPLAELAPDFVHPVLGKTVQQIFQERQISLRCKAGDGQPTE